MKAIQIVLGIFATCSVVDGTQQDPIVIENAHMRYTISSEGKNLGFIDLASGTDYLRRDRPSVCAQVRCNGTEYPATSARLENGRLTIAFDRANVTAVLRVEAFALQCFP